MWNNHSQGKDDWLFGVTLVGDLWRDFQAINSVSQSASIPAAIFPGFMFAKVKNALQGSGNQAELPW